MRAVVVREPGAPEVMELTEVADPQPGPTEIVVEIAARGVNFIDTYQRSGAYPMTTPFTPGVEAAGVVSACGAEVSSVVEGQRVAWVMLPGGYAERAVIPAERAIPLPDEITTEQAAAVLLQGLTAHYLTYDTYAVQDGDTVVVHAAAGGVGLLLVRMAKLRGAHVLGTVSTAAKAELARTAGADELFGYPEAADGQDLAEQVRERTGGTGVAAVYDGVGAATFEASLASLRRRGVLVVFGQASGPVAPVDPQRLNQAGSVYLTRPNLADHLVTRAELLHRSAELLRMVSSGDLDVHVGARYDLAQAAQAHTDLAARRTAGKVVLL